jgi:hypothetical protein
MEFVCRDIRARLSNVRHLVLTVSLLGTTSLAVQHYSMAYKHILGSYQLASLTTRFTEPFDATAMLETQVSTLVELDTLLLIVADPATGFRVASFPRLKRLKLHSTRRPEVSSGVGCVLDFGKAFPLLESLDMYTEELCHFGGEDLGSILHITSTCTRLQSLKLSTSQELTAIPSTLPIVFNHLESLELWSHVLKEEHMRLLAAVHWPSLTLIHYWSERIYPRIVPQFLNHTPKLEWLTICIRSYVEFFPDVAKMFGQTPWPNLQGVCIDNWSRHTSSRGFDQVKVMKKACPNALIHLKFTTDDEDDGVAMHGVNLPRPRGFRCDKCAENRLYT